MKEKILHILSAQSGSKGLCTADLMDQLYSQGVQHIDAEQLFACFMDLLDAQLIERVEPVHEATFFRITVKGRKYHRKKS